MWNPNDMVNSKEEDDDSWEVKAFAEDTSNVMGTTWPPRSYTCAFCKREFRSAQALGGHMNVHRRDRARLHQAQLPNLNISSTNSNSSTLLIPTQELVANGGLCLLYSLPKANSNFNPSSLNNNIKAVSPHSFTSPLPSNSSYTEASNSKRSCKSTEKVSIINDKKRKKIDSAGVEGIDLELRLGCNSFGY